MSTRAERRLKEAQEAHQDAVSAHLSVTSRFNALDAQATAGDPVDPVEFTTAESAMKIAGRRMESTQRAVQQEQTVVTQERARAAHRELVEEAAKIPPFENQAAPLADAIAAYAAQARGGTDAWQSLYYRVQKHIGAFPWDGAAAAVETEASGIPDVVTWHVTDAGRQPESSWRLMPDRFYLDGVVYRDPNMASLEEQLHEEVRRVFREVGSGIARIPTAPAQNDGEGAA